MLNSNRSDKKNCILNFILEKKFSKTKSILKIVTIFLCYPTGKLGKMTVKKTFILTEKIKKGKVQFIYFFLRYKLIQVCPNVFVS